MNELKLEYTPQRREWREFCRSFHEWLQKSHSHPRGLDGISTRLHGRLLSVLRVMRLAKDRDGRSEVRVGVTFFDDGLGGREGRGEVVGLAFVVAWKERVVDGRGGGWA